MEITFGRSMKIAPDQYAFTGAYRKQFEMYLSLAVLKTQAGELPSPIRTRLHRTRSSYPSHLRTNCDDLCTTGASLFMGCAQKWLLDWTTFLHRPSFQVSARCILTNVMVTASFVKGRLLDFRALLTSLRSRLAVIFRAF